MTQSRATEAEIFVREEMREVRTIPFAGGEAVWVSSRSPVKDTENEDALALIPASQGRAVIAVADGMGGHAAGGRAAATALEQLARAINDAVAEQSDSDLRFPIMNGIEEANRQIIDMGLGAGTTLALVEIDGPNLRPYHVGDSMILVVGQRGKVKHQTIAHSPVGYMVEAGLIDESDAIHHEDRHLVSNIVGCDTMRIEVGSALTMSPRDTAVVASDGLFDNLQVKEIIEAVRKGPLTRAAMILLETARVRMTDPDPDHPSKPDDLSFILFRPMGPPGSTGPARKEEPA